MNDDVIKRKIIKIFRNENQENIEVKVENSIVFLNGTINSWNEYIKFGLLAGKIKSIQGVVNDLKYPAKINKNNKKIDNKNKIGKYDITIIGGGVIGCSIARELSKYKLDVALVEKQEDVACGTTKANNGMIHTGIGEDNGFLKQELCVKGHLMYDDLTRDLNVPYNKCGMWIILTKETLKKTKVPRFIRNIVTKNILPYIIIRRGKKLGIPMQKVTKEQFLKQEPNITNEALVGIFSPTYGMISPYLFTIALAENASDNGVSFYLDTEVTDIITESNQVKSVVTTKGTLETKYVINAAGLYVDDVAEMAGAREYTIHPKKGATIIFDKKESDFISHSLSTIYLPKIPHYKWGGIMTTMDGNLQWGPSISEEIDKENVSVTLDEINQIFDIYSKITPSFPKETLIKYFSGLRACTFTEDFIIRPAKKIKGFIHVAGIQSPGLASAPAIAEMVVNILNDDGLILEKKENFNPKGKKQIIFKNLNIEQKNRIIKEKPSFGRIVCRCEQVTEGEIIDAIHSDISANNMDAIKRRTRVGMGRCQGGFCLPRVAKILSRETNILLENIIKNDRDSNLFIGGAKCLMRKKKMIKTDVAVIGGGPAGMAAALKASESVDVLLIERDFQLGGILPQCIHDGFGNFVFNKMITGPEYSQCFIDKIKKSSVNVLTDTSVLEIKKNKEMIATNPYNGIFEINAKSIILAMGCRERTRNQILIPGMRPAGIYTAGTAQRLINIEGVMTGKKIVILGSGDIGLIMARRFTLEGAKVVGVFEIMPEPVGLTRNLVQCLEDYKIPLYLSHTVVDIIGNKRIKGVTIAKVDRNCQIIKKTEENINCDCLILAVGLIPENELSRQIDIKIDNITCGPIVDERMETSEPGFFACGNVVQVFDLVDDVTIVGEIAGKSASEYVKGIKRTKEKIKIIPRDNVKYIIPQLLNKNLCNDVTLYFRVVRTEKNSIIEISDEDKIIFTRKKRIVKPSEIIKIKLDSDIIKTIKNKKIFVKVKGENK